MLRKLSFAIVVLMASNNMTTEGVTTDSTTTVGVERWTLSSQIVETSTASLEHLLSENVSTILDFQLNEAQCAKLNARHADQRVSSAMEPISLRHTVGPEHPSQEPQLRDTAMVLGQGCPSAWDSFTCWPPTEAGRALRKPCAHIIASLDISLAESDASLAKGLYAYRVCGDDGNWLWGNWTNYTECLGLINQQVSGVSQNESASQPDASPGGARDHAGGTVHAARASSGCPNTLRANARVVQVRAVAEDVRGHGLHQLDVRRGTAAAFARRGLRVPAGRALPSLLRPRLGIAPRFYPGLGVRDREAAAHSMLGGLRVQPQRVDTHSTTSCSHTGKLRIPGEHRKDPRDTNQTQGVGSGNHTVQKSHQGHGITVSPAGHHAPAVLHQPTERDYGTQRSLHDHQRCPPIVTGNIRVGALLLHGFRGPNGPEERLLAGCGTTGATEGQQVSVLDSARQSTVQAQGFHGVFTLVGVEKNAAHRGAGSFEPGQPSRWSVLQHARGSLPLQEGCKAR
ncbi:uncharacterized protein LOC119165005 isoform X2 [Rhipicephalus microplus]|uniref:uncharacterized protein LOC119165005 isoform X2 n=1 Tax=Rhipicephalus microplus TaxID=6941 RepID=UPI003F6A8424